VALNLKEVLRMNHNQQKELTISRKDSYNYESGDPYMTIIPENETFNTKTYEKAPQERDISTGYQEVPTFEEDDYINWKIYCTKRTLSADYLSPKMIIDYLTVVARGTCSKGKYNLYLRKDYEAAKSNPQFWIDKARYLKHLAADAERKAINLAVVTDESLEAKILTMFSTGEGTLKRQNIYQRLKRHHSAKDINAAIQNLVGTEIDEIGCGIFKVRSKI